MSKLRRNLIAWSACLLLLCSTGARAQEKEADAVRSGGAATAKKAVGAKKSKKADKKKAGERRGGETAETAAGRFWMFGTLGTFFDTNILHDEQGVKSFGFVPSVGFHFQDDAEKPSFTTEYEAGLHRYTGTNEFDRLSQYFSAEYRRQLFGRLSARTTGEVSLKGSSEDRDVNNQYSLEQQLQMRLGPSSRVSAFAAYRVKRYPLVDVEKNAIDPYVGGKFQQKLRGGRELGFTYRYDRNHSQGEKDFYVRRTFEAEYSTPLFRGKHDLLTVEARYSPRRYARLVKTLDGTRAPRLDRRWVLEAGYERPLKENVQLGLKYQFEKRVSNDPDKPFNAHLFGVSVRFKWWQR
ncbi:MAG TPA: hypothetical protein VF538_16250 [Pyrinomonadaceae bacterium]|jgi:hypothetical protein